MGLGQSESCLTPDMLSHITPMGYYGPARTGFRKLQVFRTIFRSFANIIKKSIDSADESEKLLKSCLQALKI